MIAAACSVVLVRYENDDVSYEVCAETGQPIGAAGLCDPCRRELTEQDEDDDA